MFLVLVFLLSAAQLSGWTFCIAEAGDDIFVTDVFESDSAREKLEANFAARLRLRGSKRPDVQCPAPLADQIAAVNAQYTAIAFQRALGRTLHNEPPLILNR